MYTSIIFTTLFGALTSIVNAQGPTAKIKNGTVVGTTAVISGATVNQFLGIPYVAKPDRFAMASPMGAWSGTRQAQQFGPSCISNFGLTFLRPFTESVFSDPKPPESEDCLFINVFAPAKAGNYPVMFWIYGGAWQFGDASQNWYNGSHLAALEDVVVVTFNYRTNVFGLPMSQAIPVNQRNLAMYDQRFALQWVQENIQAFGGNPSQVTVFGQSAGAFAVDALITSNAPNFQAAIMQSGVYAYLPIGNCNNSYDEPWRNLSNALGCTQSNEIDRLNCVKNYPNATNIKSIIEDQALTFSQACDDITLVSNPRTRLEAGQTKNVPVMLGSNTADGSYYSWVYTIGQNGNVTAYASSRLRRTDGFDKLIAQEYGMRATNTAAQNITILETVDTDWFFHCPAYWYSLTSTKSKPTYRYLFNAEFPNTRARIPTGWRWDVQYQGAWHTSEIPIVFTSYTGSNTTEDTLSGNMRHAWASFAKNPAGGPQVASGTWPRVGSTTNDVYEFGIDKGAQSGPVKDTDSGANPNHCKFWEAQGYKNLHL